VTQPESKLPLVVQPGWVEAHGKLFMLGPKGEYTPPDTIKPTQRLQNDTARSLFDRAKALSAELAAFKAWAFAEVDAYCALMLERYQAKAGGEKGNMTLYAYDGSIKVTVQTADRMAFGPEIQAAKALIDELVLEKSANSDDMLVVLVQDAFRTDKEGQLNRYAILALRRHDFPDPRWKRAMEAIQDSERVLSSARYIRFHERPGCDPEAIFQAVSLNLATAGRGGDEG